MASDLARADTTAAAEAMADSYGGASNGHTPEVWMADAKKAVAAALHTFDEHGYVLAKADTDVLNRSNEWTSATTLAARVEGLDDTLGAGS